MSTNPQDPLDVIGQSLTLAENSYIAQYGDAQPSPYERALNALKALRREREEEIRIKKSDVPEYLEYDLIDMEADVHFEKQAKDWSIYNAARLVAQGMGDGG